MISSSIWDGKIVGISPIPFRILERGVYLVKRKLYGRICIATAISGSFLVSSGRCIKKHEYVSDYSQFFVQVGVKKIAIEYMKCYDKYNPLKQHEFDIGIIKVSNLANFKESRKDFS